MTLVASNLIVAILIVVDALVGEDQVTSRPLSSARR
jgi:hypothetical protein